ncbi:MAG: MBL fold metallo-hydrolase [Vicinamibacteria bacterium]
MRRWLLAAGAILAACVGVLFLFEARIEQALFERGVARSMALDNSALLRDDALRVAIAGSSSPLPSPRAKACVAVFAGGRFYVVDSGPESTENLVRWGIPLARIGGVFLTHFHSDHVGELGELNLQTWAAGRAEPLDVYGGPGVERVVGGFNDAYRQDQGYRTAHHSERWMPPAAWPMVPRPVKLDGPPVPERSRSAVALERDGLKVTALEVVHEPVAPAYAYRFDYKGRSVVVTGDLSYHAPLVKGAQGADVLVSEAIARPMVRTLEQAARDRGNERVATIMHDIQSYHVAPEEAADIANKAGVKLLVFYHMVPAPDVFLTRRLFARGIGGVRKDGWTLADDGSLYTLPVGSGEIAVGRVPY